MTFDRLRYRKSRKMRIITGKYKGRHFDIPRSFKARPTTDFAKENIFNVLNAYIDFEWRWTATITVSFRTV